MKTDELTVQRCGRTVRLALGSKRFQTGSQNGSQTGSQTNPKNDDDGDGLDW